MNEGALRVAWESSQRSTKEDWAEWMRHFSVELLKESPSRPLRTCAGLAQLQVTIQSRDGDKAMTGYGTSDLTHLFLVSYNE